MIKCAFPLYSDNQFLGNFKRTGLIYKIIYDEDKYSLDSIDDSKKEYKINNFPDNAVFEKVKSFHIQDKLGSTTCEIVVDEHFDMTRSLQLIG